MFSGIVAFIQKSYALSSRINLVDLIQINTFAHLHSFTGSSHIFSKLILTRWNMSLFQEILETEFNRY